MYDALTLHIKPLVWPSWETNPNRGPHLGLLMSSSPPLMLPSSNRLHLAVATIIVIIQTSSLPLSKSPFIRSLARICCSCVASLISTISLTPTSLAVCARPLGCDSHPMSFTKISLAGKIPSAVSIVKDSHSQVSCAFCCERWGGYLLPPDKTPTSALHDDLPPLSSDLLFLVQLLPISRVRRLELWALPPTPRIGVRYNSKSAYKNSKTAPIIKINSMKTATLLRQSAPKCKTASRMCT
jgi:hypothetical protein